MATPLCNHFSVRNGSRDVLSQLLSRLPFNFKAGSLNFNACIHYLCKAAFFPPVAVKIKKRNRLSVERLKADFH